MIAQNVAGWSGLSNEVVGTPNAAPPSVPTSVVASAGDGSVTLAWAASSSATGYRVYRNGTLVASPTTTGHIDIGLTNGQSYSYTVVAVNGALASAASSAVSCTPVATPPSAPTNLAAVAGNAQVVLTWTAPSGATGYRVYRNGTLIASPATPGYTDTAVTNGTTYSYTVAAVRQNSPVSATSSSVSATPTVPPLAAPAGLAATPGDTQVALSWTAVSGATSLPRLPRADARGQPGEHVVHRHRSHQRDGVLLHRRRGERGDHVALVGDRRGHARRCGDRRAHGARRARPATSRPC